MIHDESTPRQWRHVDTCVNPADIASRGAKGSELHNLELWLQGPKFLRKVLEPLLCRYSLWDSLLKAIAWLTGFKEYLVSLLNKDPDSIPKVEVINTESVIVKAVQHDAFPVELALVGQKTPGDQKKCVPRSTPIHNLNPFVAEGY